MRVRQLLVFVVLLCGFQSSKTYGQVVSTWTDASGNWGNAANWSTLTVPNNSGGTTYDAVINGTGTDTVTFDASGTVINSLTLGPGETFQDNGVSPALRVGSLTNLGTINWQNGSNLTIAGSFTNNLPFNGNLTGTVNITGSSVLRTGDVDNLGALNIDASNLIVNGDYSTDFPGFSTLGLQDGSVGTISGSIISCAPHTCTTGIGVSNSSLSVGGGFLSGDTGISRSTLRVQGDLHVLEGGELSIQGSSVVVGSISDEFATVIQIDNSSVIAGGISVVEQGAEAVINNSSVTVNGIFVGGTGHLSVTGGTLTVLGDVQNLGGEVSMDGTVTGTVDNGQIEGAVGLFNLGGSAHAVRNSGSMEVGSLTVTGGGFNNNAGGSLTLSGVANIIGGFTNSGGSVIVSPNALLIADKYSQSGGSTDVSGILSTASYKQSGGDTIIENGGTISATTFKATGGTVTVNGTLDPTAVEIGSGATLLGTGKIVGSVAMSGTMIPGGPGAPGTLTIFGNYEQTGNGILTELISPSSNSLLNVSGDVALDSDSALSISLLDGFNPLGDTFTIMDYASLVGQFSNGTSFWGDGFLWDVSYGANQIDVTAVRSPEPSSLFLLCIGFAALALCAQRKMAKTHLLA